MNLQAAAENGAKFLDRYCPGWEWKVMESGLDMEDCTYCVLGQVFGSFRRGLEALSVRLGQVIHPAEFPRCQLGFDCEGFDRFSDLTEAWKEEIRKRRGVAA